MNKTLAIVVEDGSSPAVSCLKFEPRVSNFISNKVRKKDKKILPML